MGSAILEIILIGAKIFSKERQRHFENEAKKLQETIYRVEDSGFYHKDQERKGLAERQIERRTVELASEFIREGKK